MIISQMSLMLLRNFVYIMLTCHWCVQQSAGGLRGTAMVRASRPASKQASHVGPKLITLPCTSCSAACHYVSGTHTTYPGYSCTHLQVRVYLLLHRPRRAVFGDGIVDGPPLGALSGTDNRGGLHILILSVRCAGGVVGLHNCGAQRGPREEEEYQVEGSRVQGKQRSVEGKGVRADVDRCTKSAGSIGADIPAGSPCLLSSLAPAVPLLSTPALVPSSH